MQPIKTWTNLYPILRVAWSRGRSLSYFRRTRIAHAQDRRYDYSHDDDAPRRPRDLERDDEDGERGTAGEHHHFDQRSDTKEKHDRSSAEQNSFLPPRSPADSSKVSSVRRRRRHGGREEEEEEGGCCSRSLSRRSDDKASLPSVYPSARPSDLIVPAVGMEAGSASGDRSVRSPSRTALACVRRHGTERAAAYVTLFGPAPSLRPLLSLPSLPSFNNCGRSCPTLKRPPSASVHLSPRAGRRECRGGRGSEGTTGDRGDRQVTYGVKCIRAATAAKRPPVAAGSREGRRGESQSNKPAFSAARNVASKAARPLACLASAVFRLLSVFAA